MTRFAIATRDELWSRGRLLERRLSHGEAMEDSGGILASDACDDALVAACDVAMGELRACVLPEFRMRLVAEATVEGVTRTIVVSDGVHSIVTHPEFFESDVALLRSLMAGVPDVAPPRDLTTGVPEGPKEGSRWQARSARPPDCRPMTLRPGRGARARSEKMGRIDPVAARFALATGYLLARLRRARVAPLVSNPNPPFLWRNGTAAVLLHEALGHPREHGHPELEWPEWLQVDVDLKMRRETFRDVPLLRMKHIVATQQDAPFDLSDKRIEVLLVEGGIYEPLTETVTLRIAAADLVEQDTITRLAPFTLTATRQTIARSFLGAAGESLRYPGVICSREGQELLVPSWAPLILTEAL